MAFAQMRSTELAGLQRKTSAFVLTKQGHENDAMTRLGGKRYPEEIA
jgi:hypothetical protein